MTTLARSWLRAGLRARLLGVVALAMVPILALIVLMNVQDRREKTSQEYAEAARIVRLGVGERSEQVDLAFHVLVGLSQNPETWTPDDERCSATVRDIARKFPMYSALGVARTDGEVVCSSVPRPRRISFADREWFQRALATRRITVAGLSNGRLLASGPLIVVALPLVDEGGVQAVAFAGLRFDWLKRFALEAQLGRDGTLKVVDARGTVLAREPATTQGTAERLPESHIRAVVTAGRGSMEERGLDGVERLYAFGPLVAAEDSSGLYLEIGLPRAEAIAQANRALARNLLLLAIAAALAFAAAWSSGTLLVMKAVRGLLVATKRLSDGDLTTRVDLSGHHGELSELARAFDEMAGALEQREADLAAAAAARRAVEARLQWATIAETSSDAIVGLDRNGTVFSWNAGAEALFGYPVAEAVGRSVTMFIPSDWRERAAATFERVRRGERVSDHEVVGTTKDGRRLDLSITLSLIRESDGKVLGFSAIVRDITERRRADARLRVQSAALEAAANGIVITAADGTIEWVNAAFTTMTGYGADEAVGRTPRILKSGQHDDALYEDLWKTVCDGRVWHGRLVNRRKDGTLYDEEETITPVLDEHGAIARFVAIKQDVTAERQAEDALRRSEEHFRSLIDNALDMIFVLDATPTIVYASPSVERATGFRPDELVGRSALERIHPDDLGPALAVFAEAKDVSGFIGSAECRVRHKDGSWRTFEAVGRKLVESGVDGVVVNARDITERKRAEAVQRHLQNQLAQTEKLAAMGNILAGVAHELNNPLAVVIGHATLLEQASRGTDGAGRATKIHEAAARCARIVKNFLALARQHAPERARTDLRQLVRDTVEMMAYPLRVDEVQVTLDLPDDVPLVAVDPHQIQQVLVNLITNAHHAMREVASSRRLAIALRRDEGTGCATLTVSDTGPGMSHGTRQRLFEPFFTTKPVGQGTGLGLSICKGIVESHGGRIAADTVPGRGASFTVALPMDASVTAAPSAADSVPPLRACRVLVVDDEPDVVSVLTDMLTADGHAVDAAGNGREALVKIDTAAYDAIISDIKMPGMDGPGLYRAVVQRHPELSRRFVFVTGDTLNPATARFLEETRVVSFPKPFSPETTRAALSKVAAGAGARPHRVERIRLAAG